MRIGGLRAPQVALLVAGREGLRPGGYDDVEVEGLQSILILDVVDHAHGKVDTETSKERLVEVGEAFRSRRIARYAENLDAQSLAGPHVGLPLVAHLVASLPH